jgi:hypothetical protein
MRTCPRCHISHDRTHTYCAPCHLEYNRRWRSANREKVSAWGTRGQGSRGQQVAPEKRRAHWAVDNAVRRGHIARPDRCSLCDSVAKVQAHHADYSKPMEITWLCQRCHQRLHTLFPQLSSVA